MTLPEGTGIRTVFDEGCVAAGLIPDVALVASAPARSPASRPVAWVPPC